MDSQSDVYDSIYLLTDSEDFRAAIRAIVDKGYDVIRPTEHQLKIGPVNFYPIKGTIYFDGRGKKEKKKGLAALFEVLAEHCETNKTL